MKTNRYSKVAIGFHWTLALLIIGQIVGGIIMHRLDPTSFKFSLYQWHKSFGILILAVSVLRLVWRLLHKPPALSASTRAAMKPFEVLAAKITHIVFYVMMIGIPLSGWAMVSSSPTQIKTVLFKVLAWPDLPGLTRSEVAEDIFKQLHEYMAMATVALIVLHVGAALKHHFINKDDVLSKILPILKSKSKL